MSSSFFLEGTTLNNKKVRILQVKIEDQNFGISTSSIEAIRELKDVSFNIKMDQCKLKDESTGNTVFPILNLKQESVHIQHNFLDQNLARIIFVIEKKSEKRGAILVDAITDLRENLASENLSILDITKLFITSFT